MRATDARSRTSRMARLESAFQNAPKQGAPHVQATLTVAFAFRATGIREYPRNGDQPEIARRIANHESARAAGLYDRRAGSECIGSPGEPHRGP